MRNLKSREHRILPLLRKKEIVRAFGKSPIFNIEEKLILENWDTKTKGDIKNLLFIILSHHLVDPLETEHLRNLITYHMYTFPDIEEKEDE